MDDLDDGVYEMHIVETQSAGIAITRVAGGGLQELGGFNPAAAQGVGCPAR